MQAQAVPVNMESTALVTEACGMLAQAGAGGTEEFRVPNLPSYGKCLGIEPLITLLWDLAVSGLDVE